MRVLMQLVLAVSLIAFLGCARTVRFHYDPLAIFPATATWVWNDAKNILPDHPSMEILHIDRLLRAAVEEGFAGRGLFSGLAKKNAEQRRPCGDSRTIFFVAPAYLMRGGMTHVGFTLPLRQKFPRPRF